jgi:hypothetical protein
MTEEEFNKHFKTWAPAGAAFAAFLASCWAWFDARDTDLLICRSDDACHASTQTEEWAMFAFIVSTLALSIGLALKAWSKSWPPDDDDDGDGDGGGAP